MRAWWKTDRNGGHADPELERESAKVVGRLDELCDRLADVLGEADRITGEINMEDVQRHRRKGDL